MQSSYRSVFLRFSFLTNSLIPVISTSRSQYGQIPVTLTILVMLPIFKSRTLFTILIHNFLQKFYSHFLLKTVLYYILYDYSGAVEILCNPYLTSGNNRDFWTLKHPWNKLNLHRNERRREWQLIAHWPFLRGPQSNSRYRRKKYLQFCFQLLFQI